MSNPLAAPRRGTDSNGEASTSSARGPEASFHAGAHQASAPCRKYRVIISSLVMGLYATTEDEEELLQLNPAGSECMVAAGRCEAALAARETRDIRPHEQDDCHMQSI